MILINKGQDGYMTVQVSGNGKSLMSELSIGAAHIMLQTLKDEYKDPESLREEGRHLGEIVGKIMVDMLTMQDYVQSIDLSPDKKKGENLN